MIKEEIVILVNNILLSGGTERSVINLSNSIITKGYKVTIVSIYSEQGTPFFEIDSRIKIVHMNMQMGESLFLRSLAFYKLIKKITRFLDTLNEKSIVIGTLHSLNILLSIIKKSFPSIIFLGCEHTNYNNVSKPTKLLRKITYNNLNAIIVLTNQDKEKFKEIGVRNVEVIPNQVSFDVEEVKDKLKILLSIGRFSYEKGFDLLLHPVSLILKNNPDWKLLLIGDGPEKTKLINIINELKIDTQVLILPFQKNIIDYYKKASIYLMASRAEGFPMVLLEAKAFGLPIVAYDCPTGPAEIIEENDGYLIPFENSKLFVDKTQELIDNNLLRKQFSDNAQQNVKKYSSENIWEKWINLFNKFK